MNAITNPLEEPARTLRERTSGKGRTTVSRPIDGMIVGAHKAGTSSLARYLAQHPGVRTHPQREMTFFVMDGEYEQGYEVAWRTYFGDGVGGEPSCVLAKNVGVMYSEAALDRLKNHNPSTRIVLVLRNPVDRAYSAFWYARRMTWEPLKSFEDAIEAEPARLREDPWKWRHCAYVERGLYGKHLEAVHACFDPEQVLVLLLEDLIHDARQVVRGTLRHLGLDGRFEPTALKRYNAAARTRSETVARLLRANHPVRNLAKAMLPGRARGRLRAFVRRANEKEYQPPPMNAGTRERLAAAFAESNRQLVTQIGCRWPLWQ